MLFSLNNEFTLTVNIYKSYYYKTIIAILLFFLYYTNNIYSHRDIFHKYYFLIIVKIQFI